MPLKPGMPDPGGNASVLQHAGHHLRACLLRFREACPAASDPILKGNAGNHPEYIRLVSVAENFGKLSRPEIQRLRKLQLVVQTDSRFRNGLPALRQSFLRKTFNQFFLKKDIPAQLRVIRRLGIHKSTVAPCLLETPDIVQQAEEPGKIRILVAHPKCPRIAVTQVRHAKRVLHFMPDQNVLHVILLRVAKENILRLIPVIHFPPH